MRGMLLVRSVRMGRTRQRATRLAPVIDSSTLGGMTGGPALVVDQLTKRFGERTAFSDVSFEVAHGEVFGFLGPNGAARPPRCVRSAR